MKLLASFVNAQIKLVVHPGTVLITKIMTDVEMWMDQDTLAD